MRTKRFLSLLMALCLCLGLCSFAAAAEKAVITIWSKNRHDADYVQAKIDAYNANNTDNIEVVYQLYTDNYVQAVDLAIQNNELPDMLVYQEQVFTKYYLNDQWADLHQWMDADMENYFASVITSGYNEINGKLYFITCLIERTQGEDVLFAHAFLADRPFEDLRTERQGDQVCFAWLESGEERRIVL